MISRKTNKLVKTLMEKYDLTPRRRWDIHFPREPIRETLARKSNTFNFRGRQTVLFKCQCCGKPFPTSTAKICTICDTLLEGEFGINSEAELNDIRKHNISRYDNIIENLRKIATHFPTK